MKARIILFLIFCNLTSVINSQELIIDRVEVSKVYEKRDKKEIELSHSDSKGPHLLIKMTFRNDTEKGLNLSPSKSRIKLLFSYRGKKYELINEAHILQEINNVYVKSGESFSYVIDDWIFSETDLLDNKKLNYLVEAFEILPTLKISYLDPRNNLDILSSGINSVVLKDEDLRKI